MSASEVIPAWRCKFPGCEQPLAFGSKDRCYYHGKLDALPILNGFGSRANDGRMPGPHSRKRYPYDLWFDGRPHTLVRGADYLIPSANAIRVIRTGAKRLGCTIVTSHTDSTITVQAQPKREAGAA